MSVKLRTVMGMFVSGLIYDDIKYHTIIVESSSGNTAIAEAYITCSFLKKFDIKFRAIIDSRIISKDDKCKGKKIMDTADETEIVNVTQDDSSGVNTRLRRINVYRVIRLGLMGNNSSANKVMYVLFCIYTYLRTRNMLIEESDFLGFLCEI